MAFYHGFQLIPSVIIVSKPKIMFFFVGISRLIAKDVLVFFAQLKTQFVVLILLDDLSKVLYKYFVI